MYRWMYRGIDGWTHGGIRQESETWKRGSEDRLNPSASGWETRASAPGLSPARRAWKGTPPNSRAWLSGWALSWRADQTSAGGTHTSHTLLHTLTHSHTHSHTHTSLFTHQIESDHKKVAIPQFGQRMSMPPYHSDTLILPFSPSSPLFPPLFPLLP